MVALTATATHLTRDTILSLLEMRNVYEIKESPNKLNLTYVVEYMDKDTELEFYFDWLTDELIQNKETTDRTIIYCQTIRQCGILYATIRSLMGNNMYVGDNRRNAIVEMLHSCTPIANKQNILESFQSENGTIRLLIATIAFGMGVDCKGVNRVIHFGPSKNVEAYVQETGRAGRDGRQSIAYVLYHGIMLNHVNMHVKSFINTKECRRKSLLKHFETISTYPDSSHLCCDNCAAQCKCGLQNCKSIRYPVTSHEKDKSTSREREVCPKQKKLVEEELRAYHKSLVMKLVGTTAMGDVKTLTNLNFMIGFSDHQISQVSENLNRIFTVDDVYQFVETWDRHHADRIISAISNVFNDIGPYQYSSCTL
jgi:superfamily II DNA helicase RecQ